MGIELFFDKKDCCACGACKNACPRNAISMVADAYGFYYPQIDTSLCIECGACKRACGYQNLPHQSSQIACYAVAAKDDGILRKSASGGFFAVAAETVLKKEGVVYGVAMSAENGTWTARHIRVDSLQALSALQGSKYVQSDTGLTYKQAEKDLRNGKTVLYSGTPCQIAGLQAYLGKNYENLVTLEVICHGVPSAHMFQDFLKTLEEKKNCRIEDFSFRTKEKGQGMNVGIDFRDARNAVSRSIRNGHLYSYMHFFLKSYIYRSNCYSCPFATGKRVADLTIGDFWGFHEEYPVLPSDVPISNAKGVSCVLVNSGKGMQIFTQCSESLYALQTQFETIAKHNAQLSTPSPYRKNRDMILQLYRDGGYSAVEVYYQKSCWRERLVYKVVSLVPQKVKRYLKQIKGLIT